MRSAMKESTRSSLLGSCRLSVAHTDDSAPSYLLMGYPLLLSECEGQILDTVLKAYPGSVHAAELAEQFGSTEGQISVQIHRINVKAKSISGRKLIIGVSHHGFHINPHM